MFFEVRKSIVINRKVADVYESVSNFANWNIWSPWQITEPDCPIKVEGEAGAVGHRQEWDGKIIGAGNMTITKALANEALEYDLIFTKPWKSRNFDAFYFQAAGDGTEITWYMKGTMPFFMFFMKKMMSAWVGNDFERGLGMLKEYLETGTIASKTSIKGTADRPPMYYIGRKSICELKSIDSAMEEDFTALEKLLEKTVIPVPKQSFSIYHKFDMVNNQCDYTSGFLYDSLQKAPDGCVAGQLPAHTAVCVEHKGPYRHLGNAWSTAISYTRAKHKINKAIPMYEVYLNNPQETEENDLLAEIYVPIKS